MAIKLGGGGGSASFINEIVTMNKSDSVVTLGDGRVYLKGGVFETNLSTYPLATTSLQYTGTNFSILSQEGAARGLTWDGTHYWVIGTSADTAFKYTAAGVYTGTSFSVASQTNTPYGIVWDGTFFWVLASNGDMYKYSSAGVYTNVAFGTSGMTSPIDVAWDGTHFYISDGALGKVFKYTTTGGTAVTNYDLSANGVQAGGITWDGTYFWVVDLIADVAFKYNSSFVYQNESISTMPETNAWGMTSKGTSLAVVGYNRDKVMEFFTVNGVPSVSSLGGHNYVRVA